MSEETKDPMSPKKIKQQEPTGVKRDPADQNIVEQGETGSNPEHARELARSKGMAKGIAGAARRHRHAHSCKAENVRALHHALFDDSQEHENEHCPAQSRRACDGAPGIQALDKDRISKGAVIWLALFS
jgi:hypothetical protein